MDVKLGPRGEVLPQWESAKQRDVRAPAVFEGAAADLRCARRRRFLEPRKTDRDVRRKRGQHSGQDPVETEIIHVGVADAGGEPLLALERALKESDSKAVAGEGQSESSELVTFDVAVRAGEKSAGPSSSPE